MAVWKVSFNYISRWSLENFILYFLFFIIFFVYNLDWLYAAGWDNPQLLAKCRLPQESDSNSSSTVDISGAKNRALVFLVETADLKTPPQSSLGGSFKVCDL